MAAIAKLFGMVLTIILLIYVAFFAVVNHGVVAVTLWPQSAPLEAPLWLITLLSFSAGLILVGLIASVRISALRLALYRANKRFSRIEQAKMADETPADSLRLKG